MLIGPLAFIPCFLFTNVDVLILSIFLLIQFCYIAWYMIDQEEFASANIDDYDFSGDENNDSQEEKYDDNYFNHSVKRDR